MTCKEVVERLSEYWSGELDEETKSEVTAHLQVCPTCRQEWTLMQAAMNSLRNAPTPEPPSELLSRIQSAVKAKQLRRPVLIWRWQWTAAASAAVIVLVAISLPLFRTMREKARQVRPFVSEMAAPSLTAPTLKLPPQPAPPEPSAPPALSPSPSPMERIAEPKQITTVERSERVVEQRRSTEAIKPPVARQWKETPSLQVPTGEQILGQVVKDISADIASPETRDAPKIAQLPTEPRGAHFRAELELGRSVKAPGAGNIESALEPQGPTGQRGLAVPAGPALSAPMGVIQKGMVAEQQFAIRQQFGGGVGGLGQTTSIAPFSLRLVRFEPVVVGRVKLWELALKAEVPQIVTVFVQPSEKVEILNAQKPAEERVGLVVLSDVLPANKEIAIPLLVRVNELGARKLLITVEAIDKKTFSWWCIFPATNRESSPQLHRSIPIQVGQWTVVDLLAHLAWEGKVAFLIPEHIANRTVILPTGITPVANVLALLERQLGGRWLRFGSTFNFSTPPSTFVVPTMKQ